MITDAKKTLESYLNERKVPHGLLFISSNLEAIEQKAIDFIYEVLQLSGLNEDGLCKIRSGTHPDLMISQPFSKSATYTIEQIKEICSKSQLYPHEAPAQFFLLRYADRMQEAASNALLKTLEEPAAFSHFILLAQNEEEVSDTLKSRMQKVFFKGMDDSQEEKKSHQILQKLLQDPGFSYNMLHLTCQEIQKEVEQSEVSLNTTLQMTKEGESLFLEIEKWMHKLKNPPFSLQKFEKIFEEAKIGFQRSIKLSICLESLLLHFIS